MKGLRQCSNPFITFSGYGANLSRVDCDGCHDPFCPIPRGYQVVVYKDS
jgi:hypothetical protein